MLNQKAILTGRHGHGHGPAPSRLASLSRHDKFRVKHRMTKYDPLIFNMATFLGRFGGNRKKPDQIDSVLTVAEDYRGLIGGSLKLAKVSKSVRVETMRFLQHQTSKTCQIAIRRPFINAVLSRLINCCLLITTLVFSFSLPIYAQQPVYVDSNDVYVDAPVDARPGRSSTRQSNPRFNQLHTGFLNLGLTEALYYQYTGNPIFEDGALPNSFFFENLAWSRIVPLAYQYVPGMAYGVELLYFQSTSEDAYSGEDSTVVGPAIKAQMFIASVNLKAYFMDPIEEFLHPFFGVGWGIVFGDFDTTLVGGAKTTTSFSGMTAYRSLGTEIKLGDQWGLYLEFRTQTAIAVTSNDPFDRTADDRLELDLNGIMIGLSGAYRF
jgi:outer membrane protein W